jgi:hypothetical protein
MRKAQRDRGTSHQHQNPPPLSTQAGPSNKGRINRLKRTNRLFMHRPLAASAAAVSLPPAGTAASAAESAGRESQIKVLPDKAPDCFSRGSIVETIARGPLQLRFLPGGMG